MSLTPEQEQLSREFKFCFGTEHGQKVIKNLKKFCRSEINQSIFDPESARQTDFNLGAHTVYRYIESQIEMKTNETQPEMCIDEPVKGE